MIDAGAINDARSNVAAKATLLLIFITKFAILYMMADFMPSFLTFLNSKVYKILGVSRLKIY